MLVRDVGVGQPQDSMVPRWDSYGRKEKKIAPGKKINKPDAMEKKTPETVLFVKTYDVVSIQKYA